MLNLSFLIESCNILRSDINNITLLLVGGGSQKSKLQHLAKKLNFSAVSFLEEIDNGNTHPRTFEVLSSLQRSKMEIVKHLAQFMVIRENNYKNLKYDWHNLVEKKQDALPEGSVEVTDGTSCPVAGGLGWLGPKARTRDGRVPNLQ
jgi:glycosyltransferase involved in cell wall biosynthesis